MNFSTLFLDLKFAPVIGGTATMFKHRVALYPPEKIVVLSRVHGESSAFDGKVTYRIIRKQFTGRPSIKGFKWVTEALCVAVSGITLVMRKKFDFIEAARPFPEGVAALLAGLISRKKTIINFHGEDIGVMVNYTVERIALKLMLKFADVLLCNSAYTQSLLVGLSPACSKRTFVVHPGFDPVSRESLDKTKINATRASFSGSPVMVTMGRIAERKGHDMVIRAMPLLLKDFPGLQYVIAGSLGKEEGENAVKRLETIASALDVEDHIKFILNFNDTERPYILAAADIFIMPNRSLSTGEVEGFGIVFLEAGCLGLPVIGGRSGGVPDAVQDGKTGLLVDGTSESAVAAAVSAILKNRMEYQTMAKNGILFSQQMDHVAMFEKYRMNIERIML